LLIHHGDGCEAALRSINPLRRAYRVPELEEINRFITRQRL
jgi:hypothetical protein